MNFFFFWGILVSRWNFQCYELCNIGIILALRLLFISDNLCAVCIWFGIWAYSRQQTNWIHLKREIRDEQYLFACLTNLLIVNTMSLHHICQKNEKLIKHTHTHTHKWLEFPHIRQLTSYIQSILYKDVFRENVAWQFHLFTLLSRNIIFSK